MGEQRISQPLQFSIDNTNSSQLTSSWSYAGSQASKSRRHIHTGQRNDLADEDKLPAGMAEGAHRDGRILHWSTNPWPCSCPAAATGNFLLFQQQQQSTGDLSSSSRPLTCYPAAATAAAHFLSSRRCRKAPTSSRRHGPRLLPPPTVPA
jgi:hypothetical protein